MIDLTNEPETPPLPFSATTTRTTPTRRPLMFHREVIDLTEEDEEEEFADDGIIFRRFDPCQDVAVLSTQAVLTPSSRSRPRRSNRPAGNSRGDMERNARLPMTARSSTRPSLPSNSRVQPYSDLAIHRGFDHPPMPTREGYTRSPNGEDTIVCANCDEELGQGHTELQRQCWTSKKCGHVCFTLLLPPRHLRYL